MAIVTIVQKFPKQSKDRVVADEPRIPRVKPRDVSRAEMRAFIVETLDDIDSAQCAFWACPGPDKPTRSMMTCNVCYRIKRLRVMYGWLAEPTT